MMHDTAGALLALWNDVDPGQAEAYETWHAQEHVPERCTVPGILWGRRYGLQSPAFGTTAQPMPHYLTLYGLRDAQVLDSAPYRRLLSEPTPMSRRMRPALRRVSRWVCRLHENTATPGASRLWVWALGARPGDRNEDEAAEAPRALMSGPSARGHLLAERIADAAPLPWLSTDPGRGIEGRWLCCVVQAAGPATDTPRGAAVYGLLPAGEPHAEALRQPGERR